MLANLLASSLLALATLPAPDEVRLTDGRVLVGAVTVKGDALEIRTRTGVVEVASAEVEAIRTEAELRTALKQLAEGREQNAFTQLELARTALSYGLTRDMWRHLDQCLASIGEQASVETRLRDFVAGLEPEVLPERYRGSSTRKRVRGLARQVRGSTKPAMRAAVLELLVREQGADEALRTAASTEALPEQRAIALEALQRRSAADHASFVHRRAVWDKDAEVRERATELIRAHGDPRVAVLSLAPGLMHETPTIRMRTAEAFATLGGPEAAAFLTLAGPRAGVPALASGGGFGARGHMAVTESRTILRDFDVEIAQAAAVAKPRLETVKSGVVLDVNVPAVITQRVQIENAYRLALRRIAGSDPGRNPEAWAAWLAANQPEAAALLGR